MSTKQSDVSRGDGGVRGLVLGWCVWLLGVWSVALFIEPGESQGSRAPAVRWMVFSAMIGLTLMWPVVRLSQPGGGRGIGTAMCVLRDWLCLMLVFQAVLWPLRLNGGWTITQAVWLDAAVGAWGLVAGLWIAWGRQFTSGGVRTIAAIGCVVLVLGEPTVGLMFPGIGGEAYRLSPLQTIWELTNQPGDFTVEPWGTTVLAVTLAAVGGWAVLLAIVAWWGRRVVDS